MSEAKTEILKPLTLAEKVAKSSQIVYCAYDPEARELSVVFKGSPNAIGTPGTMYVYPDFPAEDWAALNASDSIGSYLYRNVTRGVQAREFRKVAITEVPSQPAD